jgi:hypothetical protein
MAHHVPAGRSARHQLKKFHKIQQKRENQTMKRIASLLVILAGLAGACFGQTSLLQTTLTAAITGPAGYSGTSPSIQSTNICLTSATGIGNPILPGTPTSVIYIDREALGVWQVNTTTGCMTVSRGYLGTQASPHVSGAMVLVAPQYQTTLQYGGNPLPNGLFPNDPPMGGTCTALSTPATPWVNVLTGAQWICSGLTNTWVAGWNNPYATDWTAMTASVASVAGATLPSGPYFTITGSAAVTGWTIPVGFNATAIGGGCFNVVGGTGNTATWTAAGNISLAGTFTPLKVFSFCWSPVLSKFVPSATV